MTDTSTATTPVGASTEPNHASQSSARVQSQTWSCSACRISFESGREQRDHMRAPWHVENLKRRIASLPPIPQPSPSPPSNSSNTGEHQDSPESDTSDEISSREGSQGGETDIVSPFQCLFCNDHFESASSSDDATGRFDSTIEHMLTTHGFLIPDQDAITDVETFLEYLGTVVRLWRECLYCGATGSSTRGIQNHMKDKRHCQINFEREPEILEFWDREVSAEDIVDGIRTANVVSDTEIRLSSGKILSSRRTPASLGRKPRAASTAMVKRKDDLPSSSETGPKISVSGPSKDRRIARRDEMGVIGLTNQQHRALIYAGKAAQKSEAIARKAHQWAYEKRANAQKYDQDHGPLAKAKAGMHNLLPR